MKTVFQRLAISEFQRNIAQQENAIKVLEERLQKVEEEKKIVRSISFYYCQFFHILQVQVSFPIL